MSEAPEISLPRGCPRGLADALRDREATVTALWHEHQRAYLRATTAAGEVFGRYGDDPRDRAVLEHEASARRAVAGAEPLLAPPVLARGPSWMLEVAIEPEPLEGAAAVGLAVEASLRLAELVLPSPPEQGGRREHLTAARRRLRTLGSILPLSDVIRARRLAGATELPEVTSHGDFHAGNLLLSDASVWVIDWELSGLRPAGFDLMQLSATLPDRADAETLFEVTVDRLGPGSRSGLLKLRYVHLVRTIAGKLAGAKSFNRDEEGARALMAELSDARRALPD